MKMNLKGQVNRRISVIKSQFSLTFSPLVKHEYASLKNHEAPGAPDTYFGHIIPDNLDFCNNW